MENYACAQRVELSVRLMDRYIILLRVLFWVGSSGGESLSRASSPWSDCIFDLKLNYRAGSCSVASASERITIISRTQSRHGVPPIPFSLRAAPGGRNLTLTVTGCAEETRKGVDTRESVIGGVCVYRANDLVIIW